jgi:hypothetical protein
MKLWLVFRFSILLILSVTSSLGGLVTFDDLIRNTGTASIVPANYNGLTWSNFYAVNAILNTNVLGVTGYYYGMVSASNDVANGLGQPAEINSPSNFNFLAASFAGAWRSNLNIEIQGFRNGGLLYDTNVIASATNPTLFTFSYLNVDRLYFSSSGGENAGFSSDGLNFAMDNFTFEFVPEPSSLLLTCVGGLTLLAFVRRSRAYP